MRRHRPPTSPSPPSHPPDGPRSLPTARRRVSPSPFDGPSYSSFARLALRDDTPTVFASVSLPSAPPVTAEGLRPAALPPRRRRLQSALRANNPAPPHHNPEALTRSDSLLNRARRYLSLPSGLRRPAAKPPLVPEQPAAPTSLRLGALAYRRADRSGKRRSSATPTPPSSARTLPSRPTDAPPHDPTDRIRALEDQLEAARVKAQRQRRRITQLEEDLQRDRSARPALEALVHSTMHHFEAKEAALKHTIARLDHDYAAVLAEKNEAMRLLTAFVGRGGRSPPPSLSSVSEAGTDSTHQKGRRTLSMDTLRRARSEEME